MARRAIAQRLFGEAQQPLVSRQRITTVLQLASSGMAWSDSRRAGAETVESAVDRRIAGDHDDARSGVGIREPSQQPLGFPVPE